MPYNKKNKKQKKKQHRAAPPPPMAPAGDMYLQDQGRGGRSNKKNRGGARPRPDLEENEMDWVLDLIVNFMKSPRWRTPINDYIETHCVEFEEGVE